MGSERARVGDDATDNRVSTTAGRHEKRDGFPETARDRAEKTAQEGHRCLAKSGGADSDFAGGWYFLAFFFFFFFFTGVLQVSVC